MLIHMWPLFVVLIILIIYSKKRKIENSLEKILFFLCIALVGVYAMTASEYSGLGVCAVRWLGNRLAII